MADFLPDFTRVALACVKVQKVLVRSWEENLGGAMVDLTPDDLLDIDSAPPMITLQGARYPARLDQLTGR